MKFQLVFLVCLIAFSTQQECSDYPGCIDCRWRANPCGMYCAEYLCDTVACGNCTNNTCTSCVGGYVIKGKECEECDTGCSDCILDGKDKQICNECYLGFYLHNKNNTCLSCRSSMNNCYSCNTTKENKPFCTSCDYTFALNGDNVCEACPTGTLDCQWDMKKKKMVATECDTYNSYYMINSTQECKLCPENCQYCQEDKILNVACTSCNFASQSGFINKQGRCQEAQTLDANCILADYDKSGKLVCSSCTDGYIVDTKSNTCKLEQCTEITQNCAKCSYEEQYINNTYQNVKICETCQPGYYQINYGAECIKAIPNCVQFNNATSCYQCANGYYLNVETTKCESIKDPIPHCLYGYFANNNTQVLCSQCAGQNTEDPNSAYINPGYYVNTNNTECKKCPLNCSYCYEDSYSGLYCYTCAAGYMQVQVGSEYVCQKINIPNCASAAQYGLSGLQCVKCTKGYYGLNGVCKKIQKNIVASFLDFFMN